MINLEKLLAEKILKGSNFDNLSYLDQPLPVEVKFRIKSVSFICNKQISNSQICKSHVTIKKCILVWKE